MTGTKAVAQNGPGSFEADLSPLLVLTDRRAAEARGRDIVETSELVAAAAGRGAAIVLREKDLSRAERSDLARRLRQVVPRLIVASDAALAREVGAEGVHLAANDPWPGSGADGLAVGRSCHERAEVQRAAAEGATYVTLSPVFPSDSKPGYGPALGADELGGHPLAVFGLGGIRPGRAGECVAAGAAGVAVMGGVMGADAPGGVAAELLDELGGWVPDGRFGQTGIHRSAGEGDR